MALRSLRERMMQAIIFEAIGLVLVTPLYVAIAGEGVAEGAILIATLAAAVMLWAPLHNAAFDIIDLRMTGRRASDRPARWRLVHAASHEITAIAVTLPLVMAIGGYGVVEALMVDIGLTIFYVAYTYAFHLAFDRWRPVRT